MPNTLVQFFNRKAYPVGVGILLVVLGVLLLGDGNANGVDIGIMVGAVVIAGLIWMLLVSTQTEGQDTVSVFQQTLQEGDKPTIVQFFSKYCVGCLAVKPVIDQLEKEAGDRLQIIRLDIDEEPGKSLVEEYGIVYTPTFLYFDSKGNKLRDSTFILDRARVLYELEQA